MTNTSSTFASDSAVGITFAQVKNIDAQMVALKAQRDALVEYLLKAVDNQPGKHTVDMRGSFTVSENNTYNVDTMLSTLLPGQAARCMTRSLDKAVVKRLYPDAYAAAKQARGHKVSMSS